MLLDLFTSLEDIGDTVYARVTTRAATNRIKLERQDDGICFLKIYITAAPEGGKANEAIIKLLSNEFNLPKSFFSIYKGDKSRDKIIKIKKLAK